MAAGLLLAIEAQAESVLYRVNCGGPEVASVDAGPAWGADLGGAPSPYLAAGFGDYVFGSDQPMGPPHASVPAWVPAAVFADERWDPSTPEEMRWEFPVAPGTYRVRLMMADGYAGTQSPGARVFDVACEGAVRLPGFDIVATFGGYTPAVAGFDVAVNDGSLTIELRHGPADDPCIRGIEIVTLFVPGVLGVSRDRVGFGTVLLGSTSAPEQVTLTNLGGEGDPSIAIGAATISGPFAHTLTPQTLGPGQSRVFNVTFAPPGAGPATGSLSIAHGGVNPSIVIDLEGEGVASQPIAFGKSVVAGTGSFHPTSLQFGPDGRLYVAQQDGLIRIYTVTRNGANQYLVGATETIASVQALPNHGDDGLPDPEITTRLVTGLLVTGTAANPVLFVTSSDPRMNVAGDIGLDTNSGIVSRLTWNGASWDQVQLVRGLPRSENDHAPNGVALDPVTNTLYVAVGGATNMGAPSNNFSFLPEYALSACILAIDLDAIGEVTYDLPTLDDEDRPGVSDLNDPFGGNDGKNQARLVPGGPVQIHSSGWRNPFDVLLHSSGRMYSIDNGPNAGWGGPPVGAGVCTNGNNDNDSQTLHDNLHRVTAGFYAGHPNPTRASVANTFNDTNPQSPVPAGNPVECEYRVPGTDGALATWGFSTNGLAEYRSSNFGGLLQGNLLAVGHDNTMQRVALDATGEQATLVQALFSSVATVPLDVTAQGDGEVFRGTIWTCDYVSGSITVFEPSDYDTTGFVCSGADDDALDEDGDGFDNADEIDNGVSPCSAGDLPPDFDGDFTSNLNDPDDDNDGIPDAADAFALDAQNGVTGLPLLYSWDGGDPGFGLFGLGFTGLMADGVTDWLLQFDPAQLTPGGAAGKLTIDAVPAGDARGPRNDQRYAFQFGVATDAGTAPFVVRTRVSSPYFGGAPPAGAQSFGLFIGDGGDDDYLKLVVTGVDGSPALEVVHEVAGAVDSLLVPAPDLFSSTGIDLVLDVDPAAATVQPRWAVAGAQPLQPAGPPIALAPGSALHAAVTGAPPLAAGIIGTSRGAQPFTATWDFFQIASSALVGVLPDDDPLAGHVGLLPAYPNPTSGEALLRFRLAQPAPVRLAIYDITGARVATLVDGPRPAGDHTERWNGRDTHGRQVPAGMYFQRLEYGPNRQTGRLVVVR